MKTTSILILFFPLFLNAQIDTAAIKLLLVKPTIFIDSSILKRQDYNQGLPMFQGIWTSKDSKTGQVVSIADHLDGKMHGHYLDFTSTGAIQQSLYYYKGKLNGPMIFFWDNGNVQTLGNYSNGRLEGILRDFDSSGNLRNVVAYNNGNREGPEIRFYSSGNIKLVTSYSEGWENGVRKEYKDTIGNPLMGEFEIKNGLPVTGKFFENGKLIRTQSYDYEQLLKEREALSKKGGDHKAGKELLSEQ